MREEVDRSTIEFKLGELTAAVTSFGRTLGALDHRLFGNGHEGVIARLSRDVEILKQAKLEHNIRKQFIQWAFKFIGGMLLWGWGLLMGASSWLPKLHAFLRSIGW